MLIGGIAITLFKYLPVLTIQISQLIYQFNVFLRNPPDSELIKYAVNAVNHMELSKYVGQGVDILYKSITNVGKFGLQVLLSLILSLFFLLEKARIVAFTAKFKESRLAIFYTEIEYFGKKFARSFGKVIDRQFLIAVVNCVLSVIALWILGFPQLLGLALMIFLLGLIPVAGGYYFVIPALYDCLQYRRYYVRCLYFSYRNSHSCA